MNLTAYYDLSTSPASYDVVTFLLAAERARLQHRADRVSIAILPGPIGGFRKDKFWPPTVQEREKLLHQVVVPMARMLPSANEVTVWPDRPRQAEPWSIGHFCRLYGTRLFVECLRAGIRPLRPPEDIERDPGLVTITLREAEHWPERNSNVPQWIEAAQELKRQGFRVVVVRDTIHASEPIDGVVTNKAAAWDLIARAQLYRSAACNLFVNNGPAWFAMALDAPAVILKPTVEGLMRTCSAQYFAECGVKFGTQIDSAVPYHRIVWEDDDAVEILRAFEEFMSVNSRQLEVA